MVFTSPDQHTSLTQSKTRDMTEEEQVEAALLADVTGFLAACNVPSSPPTTHLKPTITVSGLHLTNDQLLAETETLLSSLASPPLIDQEQEQLTPTTPQNASKTSSRRSTNGRNMTKSSMSADERRELRNAQATKRRLRYRQKLKDEKETLQQQEVELSSELSRLQKAKMDEKMGQVDNLSLSVWKAIATRQKEKRVEAEQTQRQLRAAVIGRARMIHQMNALIQRPVLEEKPKLCNGDAHAGSGDGAALFKTFAGEIDAIYAQTDQVMKEADFKMSSKLQYTPMRTRKQGIEIFDSADAAVLPFGFKETSRAIESLMFMDPETCSYTELTRDTATVKYEMTCQLEPGEITKLQVYSVVRKYEEAGRVVFVWRSFTEGRGDLSGYHTDETGWLTVRPADNTVDCKSAIVEAYTRFIPFGVGEASNGNVDTD